MECLILECLMRVLNKGERLFLFTDGIPEAMNVNDEEYSDEKMEKIFIEN